MGDPLDDGYDDYRALVEPTTAAPVDLEINYPSVPGRSESSRLSCGRTY